VLACAQKLQQATASLANSGAFLPARSSLSPMLEWKNTFMPVALIKKRFTADEYQRMGQAGILSEGDRVELIAGEVLAMTPIGPRHNACVSSATHALVRAVGDDAIILPQGSVRLDLYNEPEPDLVLLRPRADFYASRHAGPKDILLIIEIADSSVEYDRDLKAVIYAESQIPEYWLADLTANVVSRNCRLRIHHS
jgi:Uma2 family endonuclease